MCHKEKFCREFKNLALAFGIVGMIFGAILVGSSANVALAQDTSQSGKVNELSERVAKLEANVNNVQTNVKEIKETISRFFFITLGAFCSGLVGAGGLVYGIKQRPARK